jgi:hypothetical protein
LDDFMSKNRGGAYERAEKMRTRTDRRSQWNRFICQTTSSTADTQNQTNVALKITSPLSLIR